MDTCEKANLLEMLMWLQPVLDEAAPGKWYLDGGSLLGSARNGSFIRYDTDLDLSIVEDAMPRVTKAIARRAKGTHYIPPDIGDYMFSPYRKHARKHLSPAKFKFSASNWIHVDLWLVKRHDYFLEMQDYPTQKETSFYSDNAIYFPLTRCLFEGRHYPCPRNTSAHLQLFYGIDWRTEKSRIAGATETKYEYGLGRTYFEAPDFSDCAEPVASAPWNAFEQLVQELNALHAPYVVHGRTLQRMVLNCNIGAIELALTRGWWDSGHAQLPIWFNRFAAGSLMSAELYGVSVSIALFDARPGGDTVGSCLSARGVSWARFSRLSVRVPVPLSACS